MAAIVNPKPFLSSLTGKVQNFYMHPCFAMSLTRVRFLLNSP